MSGYELGKLIAERFPPRTPKDMQACVYRWENYESGISLKNLIRVCTVLEMTIDELLVDLDLSTLGIGEDRE